VSQVSHATALQQNAYLLFYVKNEVEKSQQSEHKVTPVKQAPPEKSPLKSPEVKHATDKLNKHENGTTANGHDQDTPVKVTPVKQVHTGDSNGSPSHVDGQVKKSNVNNTNTKPAVPVTPVNRAPASIRGSGEWRVRDLSALSGLLNGNHVTTSNENTPVADVKQRSVSATPVTDGSNVKVSPTRVNDSKSSSDHRTNNNNNTNSVTRVKVSAPQTPLSVVAQLQTQSQVQGKLVDRCH
jgi:hypothetical protein